MNPELLQGAAREIKDAPPIRFEIDPNSAMVLMGALQLALRHPGFGAMPSAKAAKAVAIEIGRQLSKLGPCNAELVALGWTDQNELEGGPNAQA